MKFNLTPSEFALFVFIYVLLFLLHMYRKRLRRWLADRFRQRRGPRQLRPRAPDSCPLCSAYICVLHRKPKREVLPWSERKSKAGRPKTIDTSGYACLNARCDYFGIADPAIHALVGNGKRGKRKDIQYFRCQACEKRQSSRLGTMMYHIKTALERVEMVMTAMAEGVDISASSRIFGHHPDTIARWIERAGQQSVRLHTRLFFRALVVGHLQLDELVTKVKLRAERVWVWTAIAAKSKLLVALHVGGRTMKDAQRYAHQIWQHLKPNHLPVFTSDGLNLYFHGLTAHFGSWHKPPRARKYHWLPDVRLMYAQLRKRRSGYKLKFIDTIVRLGTREAIRQALYALNLSGRIQTAFIERANLTLRELIAPLSRRTWSLAYDVYHLWLHIQWGMAYYHLVRPHQSLRIRGPGRQRNRTPAMAAGLTTRPWSVRELLLLPVPEEVWLAPFPAR